METLKIKPQTVFMHVGPTNCGKTVFTENYLIPALKRHTYKHFNRQLNIQHLSSDNFRKEMVGYDPHLTNKGHQTIEPNKTDLGMDYVSEQAFLMLRTKLQAVLSYPVNADFVIVDTTGMSQEFRREMSEIVFKANYRLELMVFDYKNRDDYYKFLREGDFHQKKKVSDSIKRFKDKLSELTRKEFPNQTRIKSIDFHTLEFVIDNVDDYSGYFIDPTLDYIIIGDVHGCFDELKELLCAHGFVFDDDNFVAETGLSVNGNPLKIIFIGDIIDKGEQINRTIRFVHYLVHTGHAILTRGNHENFVYNYLKGRKPYVDLDKEFISTFLNSVAILNEDEPLKEMFFELCDGAKDFYATDRFIVTHAPCKIEYLGKIMGGCLKNQRNFRFARRRDFDSEEAFVANAEKEMAFMKEESRYNNPYHIVGHVMLQNVVQFNNKLMIDTGCVAGGKLTSVSFNRTTGQPVFKSVKSKRKETGEIFPLFTGPKKFDISELDPKEQTRIKYLCLDKVNYISGTMAPADKDLGKNVLESLDQAIQYYKSAGVKSLILQPKHMGSRGNVYLFKDVSQSYIVSRNGYKLKESTMEYLQPALQKLADRLFNHESFEGVTKMFILDAEILPWDLLGSGLIRQHFKPVAVAVKTESDILVEHGFEAVLKDYKANSEFEQYLQDRRILNKDELSVKYGHTKERTLRNLCDYKHLNLDEEIHYANNFSNQLETHAGEDREVSIEPFAILKVVFDDDSEHVFSDANNIDMYKMVSDRTYAILDFESKTNQTVREDQSYLVSMHGEHGGGYTSAHGFFNLISYQLRMEGIVIKPEIVYTPNVAPYIKVRNEDYLTIVYGHNYKFAHKYDKLINKKGVKKKLQTSIKEFELGLKMLKTKYSDITPDNEEYKQLLAQMIIEVEKEKKLDPRL